MPEENWLAHGGIPACDLCHARKVKCDRQVPCSNCTVAKVECLRTRHKRTARPKVRTDDKIQALVQRLSTLEDSVLSTQRVTGNQQISSNQEFISPQRSSETTSPSSNRPLKRKRTTSGVSEHAHTAPTPELDSSQKQVDEARNLIRKELSHNGLLSIHQRMVLETAISFVDQLSQIPTSLTEDRSTFGKKMYVPTNLAPGEIMQVILGTQTRDVESPSIQLHTLDHLPPKAFERIALALLDGTDDEQTLNLYKIIVHFKAAVVLYTSQLQTPKSQDVSKHIKQLQLHYLSAACTALDQISFMTPPSLLLLQALITGAMMMQIVGNPTMCWTLTAHASRTLVALGYHTIRDTVPRNDLDEEIHAAVAWCAHFDRCMSLLLLRPPSLPPLHVNLSALIKPDPTNPMSVFEIITLEMTPVHEKILELTLETGPKSGPNSGLPLKEEVARLRKQMTDIYATMEKARPSYYLETNTGILLHWQILEFKYFSTLTSVHRLSPTVTSNPLEREECLQCARKALQGVKVVEENAKKEGHFIEEYNPYLAWTLLSYPLCPFFVVFCNIVGTSNSQDFQLLQDVADCVSSLVTENKYVNRLHRLAVTLIGLCKPLVQQNGTGPSHGTHTTIPETLSQSTNSTNPTASAANNGLETLNTNSNGVNVVDGLGTSSWDDDMMWQLFQSQPSLDWFNSDILDPSWDFGPAK